MPTMWTNSFSHLLPLRKLNPVSSAPVVTQVGQVACASCGASNASARRQDEDFFLMVSSFSD